MNGLGWLTVVPRYACEILASNIYFPLGAAVSNQNIL